MSGFDRRHRTAHLSAPCRLVTGNVSKAGKVLIEYEDGERQWWDQNDVVLLADYGKEFRYEMTSAFLQLGHKPPFRLWPLKVRMHLDMPQIGISNWNHRRQERVVTWYDFSKDVNVNPPIKQYDGQPVRGVTSDWRLRQ